MIQLYTDTSANLTSDIIKEYGIKLVPFTYRVDGKDSDQSPEGDFDGKAFYDAMRNGAMVKTSMINIVDFMDGFREALDKGDDVLYIGMSGGISGAAHAASIAVMELEDEYPDRKIVAIDTFAASHGEGRFVASEEWLDKLFANGQVATQYCDLDGNVSMDEEWNVNGSYRAIEGITSPDGRVLGKMAHSERRADSVAINIYGEQDMKIFESGVKYFK